MKWSWKIAEVRGIAVFVHATFFILLAYIGFMYWSQSQNVATTIEGVGFIVAIFFCVLLHEFGHALAAARYGIKTRDITLLPIGGLARLERMPDKPVQELWVALAGPAVNVVISALLFAWLAVSATLEPWDKMGVTSGSFLQRLMVVNVFLAVFNMLPAFPMDGGRVLRALLATRMDYVTATQVAATVGQGMALIFGLMGLLGEFSPMLVFIALFVWIGAQQEASLAQMKGALAGIPVAAAMVSDFRTLHPHDTLGQATQEILAGSQQDFPVVEGDEIVGILTRNRLLMALANQGFDGLVADAMEREFQTVDMNDMLEMAFQR
ncbi:MAG TPA: site-2 protease family protein, partial [Pirellulaceae bacterium]|nr:site-2 protease family protein [Pirellulaceae bacterium]